MIVNTKLLKEKLEKYSNIVIAKHQMPDWDAVGSAFGLREIIMDNFNDKSVYIVGHDIENKFLLDDEKITDEILKSSLLITVDTANASRLDFDKISMVSDSFKIDHHNNGEMYADNEIVIGDAIACTEVITIIAKELNWVVSKAAAEYLYRGLLTDSNRFAYKNTTDRTFEAAKVLYNSGIDLPKITQEIYSRSFKQAKWNNEVFSRITFIEDINFAYVCGDYKDIEKFNLTLDEFKSAVGSMGGIKEIDVWAFAYQLEENEKVKLSLRSKKQEISSLANKYGGGGHNLACGAYINSWDQLNDFINDMRNHIKEGK